MVRRFAELLLALLIVCAPAAAFACPYCAMQDNGNKYSKVILLGAMILFPFAVSGVVYQVLRRSDRIEDESR